MSNESFHIASSWKYNPNLKKICDNNEYFEMSSKFQYELLIKDYEYEIAQKSTHYSWPGISS